jgi:NADH dehydrogenase FAD-containing subunit
VVIGGGPTGLEIAGQIAELTRVATRTAQTAAASQPGDAAENVGTVG